MSDIFASLGFWGFGAMSPPLPTFLLNTKDERNNTSAGDLAEQSYIIEDDPLNTSLAAKQGE